MVQYDEDVKQVANFDDLVREIQNITQLTCDEISTNKLFESCFLILLFCVI